jgi:dihydroorotate dehydrogenase electron transfer subunit
MNPSSLVQATVPVVENVRLARDTYRLRFRCEPLAASIRPGQFLMLRLPDRTDPLLGRAFALYDTIDDAHGRPWAIDIVHQVVGKMTGLMAGLRAGDRVSVWGPLGNGFPDYSGIEHLVLVAGGIGQTPFLALMRRVLGTKGYAGQAPRREVQRVSLYYGARSQDLLAGLEDFERAGAVLHLATDDGSRGFRGFVTQLLRQHWHAQPRAAASRWAGCGPEPMLHALAELAEHAAVPCDLSLETPMACGVGICFSCVTRVKKADGWDYARVCVDGPVFEAGHLVW